MRSRWRKNIGRRCFGQGIVYESRAADGVNLMRGVLVCIGDGQLSISRCRMVDGHGLASAPAAGWRRATGKLEAQGHIVQVGVGRVGDVCDGAGEAVSAFFGILQTRGGVQGLVRHQGRVSCRDEVLVIFELLLAVIRRGHVLGGRSHERVAFVNVWGASSVEDAHDAQQLLLRLEKRRRVLQHHGDGIALFELRVVQQVAHENRTVVIVPRALE